MRNYYIPFATGFIVFFMTMSCKTIVQSGYEKHKEKLSVDLKQHKTEYLLPDTLWFSAPAYSKIDKFDQAYFNQLNTNLYTAEIKQNNPGNMLELSLKSCVIDMQVAEDRYIHHAEDSLMQYMLNARFICTQSPDNGKLFHSLASLPLENEVIPISMLTDSMNRTHAWMVSRNYAYKPLPITNIQMEALAKKLATQTTAEIDTTLKQNFRKDYPQLYYREYKQQGIVRFLSGLGKTTLVIIVLSGYLLLKYMTP